MWFFFWSVYQSFVVVWEDAFTYGHQQDQLNLYFFDYYCQKLRQCALCLLLCFRVRDHSRLWKTSHKGILLWQIVHLQQDNVFHVHRRVQWFKKKGSGSTMSFIFETAYKAAMHISFEAYSREVGSFWNRSHYKFGHWLSLSLLWKSHNSKVSPHVSPPPSRIEKDLSSTPVTSLSRRYGLYTFQAIKSWLQRLSDLLSTLHRSQRISWQRHAGA